MSTAEFESDFAKCSKFLRKVNFYMKVKVTKKGNYFQSRNEKAGKIF